MAFRGSEFHLRKGDSEHHGYEEEANVPGYDESPMAGKGEEKVMTKHT